jgi:4-hydroxybenzoate polyprenyltransferase
LTFGYSFYLKKVVLVDILAVSVGFVIRAIAGCVAIGVNISPWLVICSFLLALFLVLNKRWHSLNVLKEQESYDKSILEFYSTSTLDKLISIVTSSLLVAYLVYAINTNKIIMIVSTIFVVYGLFRYLYLVQHMNFNADPDKALRDKGLLLSMGCWAICILMLSKL